MDLNKLIFFVLNLTLDGEGVDFRKRSIYDSLRKEETEGEMFLTPNLFIIFKV